MSGERLSGAQLLCRLLLEEGVDLIWGYPGGAIMPFYHALPEHPGLRHILVRHEQAAAHAADGYARASGRIGVCVATSGPGATNLVTGLATAHMDSSPVVAITGQVPRHMIGRDAFQETDVIGLTLPITKHSCQVRDVTELADQVREAIAIAKEGRPGPVLIDVPKDVQNQQTTYEPASPPAPPAVPPAPVSRSRAEAVAAAAGLIAGAARPLIMVGHGVILADAYDAVRQLAERTGIPVITTLLGISAFPESHPLHLGMPGMHGEVHVNRAIQQADVIVGIGLRFDDRVTGNTAGFAPRAQIVHVDLDASEIGKNVPTAVAVVGDAKEAVAELLRAVAPRRCDAWRHEILSFVRTRQETYRGDLSPENIVGAIHEVTGDRVTIVTDVGQHQMWVAKLYPYRRPNTHITSGGLGTMGFAVPAAMGVAFARPAEPVWSISGDGGFQMNLQEIATMVQEKIPVKMGIFNNGYLGMVRQWQQF
ncbi:MAG: biosynthetic-type acetolactate synthase large subunit, partial [Gemmatimonadales bacterium]